VLSAAAGATSRIGLLANILLVSTRNPVLVAREAATLYSISGGRLILGVGVGDRPDDFAVTDTDFHSRGRRFDEALTTLDRVWRGELVAGSPSPMIPVSFRRSSVPLMIGGANDRTIDRVVRWGDGWTMSRQPWLYTDFIERLRVAWHDAERAGEPRICAIVGFAFGPDGQTAIRESVADSSTWPDGAPNRIRDFTQASLRTPHEVREAMRVYREAGVTDLQMLPAIPEASQLDVLAAAIGEASNATQVS
jgi:alkanesulfonate monooxygenase SsuD/methylene tetrahydromethanopterin reductase-like flavin-dependent oxidoreductase (luciferase family)